MRWNVSQPLDAGVLHRNDGIEALGDGVGNEGGTLFLEQFDQPLLLCYQRIDLRRFPVEVGSDGDLFWDTWKRMRHIADKLPISPWHLGPEGRGAYCINNRL